MIVYADVLLLTNFYVDYLLLMATERLSGVQGAFWRRVLAGFVASLFSLGIFLPMKSRAVELAWEGFCALVTLLVAYGRCRPRAFLRRFVAFLAATYAFAGLFLLLQRWTGPDGGIVVRGGTVYLDLSPFLLIGFTTVCYLSLCLYRRLVRRRDLVEQRHDLVLTYQEKTVSLRAYYDSGNRLYDPLSGRPVVVINREAAASLLPDPAYRALWDAGVAEKPVKGFRLIPFETIGGDGLMPAFKPDEVKLDGKQLGRCYIAVSPAPLRADFDGLIGPDFFDCEEDSLCSVR